MKRLALSVGINDYPGSGSDLSGCVNDAMDWATLLVGAGYDVKTLLDQAATKAAVVRELCDMVERARFGDRIVLTYSGHGSWVPDDNGDEADARDEVLCLWDYQQGGLLSDDELYSILQSRRLGVRVTVLSDSCFSGTMQRFLPAFAQARFMPPFAFLEGADAERARAVAQGPGTTMPARPGTALVSGCSETEYSYDAYINGRANGAFTQAAVAAYRPGIRLGAWYRAIRASLPSDQYPQTPQLQASAWQRTWTL